MKRILSALLLVLMLAGCSVPNSLQLDLYQGYGRQLKLLHLNAASEKNRQRIEGFEAISKDATPLEKDPSLFAYYPDYLLEITRNGQKTTLLVDINGNFVDFRYLEEDGIYRSAVSAHELKVLVFQYS